ncbi:MAG: phenylacetate--CoA ligase family protein [Desulfovibrio sp.]|nr:MAG: phenylacetate--CoA ligase family protein [Desulfovibrio sp.]
MFWEQDLECMERGELKQLQLERLQSTLNRVSRNVPLYRNRFDELALDPDDFLSLDDVRRLPFTTKEDIREHYPYGLFAVPLREVVRLQSSSGTTGKPTVVGYTKNDLGKWTDMCARILCAGGLCRDDVLQIAYAYGLFTGGFGLHYGAERLGVSVIPSSSGNARRQIMIMQDYRTTALTCTPSYGLHLADTMMDMGVNVNTLTLKFGLFGAEPWSEAMREELQERLNIVATDNYGISEVLGPGIAGECLERNGLHMNEDHFFLEIVDPDSGDPVPEGDIGELVLTSLTKEAFPVIRFRTGDLTRLVPGDCPCGRTHQRIHRVLGRTDDMFTLRGINVFPSQVEQVLLAVEGAEPHYQILLERDNHLDKATVHVEVSDQFNWDQLGKHQELLELVQKRLSSELGVSFAVKLVENKSLERGEGKAKRVIDKRSF